MRTNCYMVVGKGNRGGANVRRVTHRRPGISADEALVRLVIDLPDDLWDDPMFVVKVERSQVQVAVDAEEVEE